MLKNFPYKIFGLAEGTEQIMFWAGTNVRKCTVSKLQPFQNGDVIGLYILLPKPMGPIYLIFLKLLGVFLDAVPLNVHQYM